MQVLEGGKKDFSFSTPSRGLFYSVLPLATKEQALCGRTLKLLQVRRSRRVFFPFSRRQSRSALLIRASGYLGGPPVAARGQTFSLITHRERRVSGGGIARKAVSVRERRREKVRRGGRLLLRGKQRFTLQPREAAPQTFHPSRGAVCISQGMIMAVTRKLSECQIWFYF